ncbi:class I SAM-dependent DNA methyltransferase [Maritimibacter fusiformis]|uniref:Class I SAM-dependent methyltransferase n=1 Tax=Maritimibacter fusiformis TaxID=2603819 RepID=A0A5D0REA5_9RHOB|nr:class I SAM-dependent methyltransferase [Maritimibacter fusiformis]TYB80020.1 class I SAM-dependent methyltransferase [Maritimibacter fusiformis]
MTADHETLLVYETRAHDYAELVGRAAAPGFADFVAALPQGGHVLDLGCGPGDSARRFLDAGFSVDAVDAVPAMVSRARELGVPARQATFDQIDTLDTYDGIWANFSLLHAPRATFPGHLARLHRALKPGGRLHIGMKLGTGEARDRLGRFYTYYSEDELMRHLTKAGFTPTTTHHGAGTGLDGTRSPWIWVQANG